jgi:carboxyl-terminal processing protease
MFSNYYVELRRKGVLNNFSLEYVEQNRTNLNAEFPTLALFKSKFIVDSNMVKEFLALAEKDSIKFDEKGWKSSELLVNTQIKALIARNLWDISAFYEVMSPIDEEFLKAVNVLEDKDIFRKLNIG